MPQDLYDKYGIPRAGSTDLRRKYGLPLGSPEDDYNRRAKENWWNNLLEGAGGAMEEVGSSIAGIPSTMWDYWSGASMKRKFAQQDELKKSLGRTPTIPESLKAFTGSQDYFQTLESGLSGTTGIPLQQIDQKLREGNIGGAAIYGALGYSELGGLNALGKGLLPKKPRVDVIPPVTPIEPPIPTRAPRIQTQPGEAVELGRPTQPWDFNDPLQPNVGEPYLSGGPNQMGAQRISPGLPGEVEPPMRVGPLEGSVPRKDPFFGSLVKEGTEGWGVEGARPAGEVSSVRPVTPAPTEKVQVKVKYRDKNGKLRSKKVWVDKPIGVGPESAEAIARKKISGEAPIKTDWLEDDPFWATIPERLRPEAPNVKMQRTLSEGPLRPKNRLQFIDEAEHLRNQGEVPTQRAGTKAPDVEPISQPKSSTFAEAEVMPDLSGKSIGELAKLAKTASKEFEKAIRQELDRRGKSGGSTLSSGGLGEASAILRKEFNKWRVLKNLPENDFAFRQFMKETGRTAEAAARTLPRVDPVGEVGRDLPDVEPVSGPMGRVAKFEQPKELPPVEPTKVPVMDALQGIVGKVRGMADRALQNRLDELTDKIAQSTDINEAKMLIAERDAVKDRMSKVKTRRIEEDKFRAELDKPADLGEPVKMESFKPKPATLRLTGGMKEIPFEKPEVFGMPERGGDAGAGAFNDMINKAMAGAEKPYLADIVSEIRSLSKKNNPEALTRIDELTNLFKERINKADESAVKLNYNEMQAALDRAKNSMPAANPREIQLLTRLRDAALEKTKSAKSSDKGTTLSAGGLGEATRIVKEKLIGKPRETPILEPGEVAPRGDAIIDKAKNKRFMKDNPVLKKITDKLISWRSAERQIGKQVRVKFKELANIPKEKIAEFQADIAAGKYENVRKWFDDIHADLKARGLDLEYKENYLPQLWDNTLEEVRNALGDKTMTEKASFQMRSFIKDYAEGINEKGLKPKYSPLELMEWYAKRANKLIADSKALSELEEAGYLRKGNKEFPEFTAGMKEMNPEFGSFRNHYAHPDVKYILENYLSSADRKSGFGHAVGKLQGKTASTILSGGVPFIPLGTFHGVGMTIRAGFEGGTKRVVKALQYGINPWKAERYLDSKRQRMVDITREFGRKFGAEDAPGKGDPFFTKTKSRVLGGETFKKTFNWITDTQHKIWERNLFDKMIPALQLEAWEANFSKFMEKGMSRAEAGRASSEVLDTFYSGKNLDLLYNDKTFNTATRILTLAPDWLRSTVDMGVKVPSSMVKILNDRKNPITQKYAAAGTRFLATYAAANLLQKYLTGKFMVENSTADIFNFQLGEDANGKPRSLKLFGTAADAFKIPLQLAMSIPQGRFGEVLESSLENRGSPGVSAIAAYMKGEDWKGEKNIGESYDDQGNYIPQSERLANTFSQAVNFGPAQISSLYNLGTGRAGLEETAAKMLELPLKYGKKKKPNLPFELPKGGKPFTPPSFGR